MKHQDQCYSNSDTFNENTTNNIDNFWKKFAKKFDKNQYFVLISY